MSKRSKVDRNDILFAMIGTRNMLIPYPPLEEQKRIAAILAKADRIRRKRQEAIRLTEELGRSIFLDMFSKYFETKYLQTFEDVSEAIIDCRNKTAPYADEIFP